ncbi:recombinase family protein [Patescibacteria group bacterium]|nr:recombinase family protein [Patescibacteria group bacterium]
MLEDTFETKKAVIYLRVSSEEQVENFSLDTQEEICRREAQRKQFEILEVFREEGRSAKTITGRPILIKLLEFCRKNRKIVDAVFVYRLDRLSRQTSDYLAIRKKLAEYEITLISATEPTGNSPTEKLIETMLAGFAQMDNDVRSERSKNGLRARFLSGLCIAKVPVGYVIKNGFAIKDGDSFDKMKKAWNLMATGTKSLLEMAEIMNKWGLRTSISGKEHKLRAQTANGIFRNKFYMGILTSNTYKEEVRGQHEAMITEEQFYKVQAIIDGRSRFGTAPAKRLKDNPDFPLRGTIKCGKCGGNLSGGWSKGRSKKYAYYICKNRCGASSIKVQVLNDSLINFLQENSPTKNQLETFLFVLKLRFNKSITLLKTKRENAKQEIEEQDKLLQTLIEKNLKGTYSDDEFIKQKTIIKDKIKDMKTLLSTTLFDKYSYEEIAKFMKSKFEDLGQTYLDSKPGIRRVLLGSICPGGLSWQYEGLSNRRFSPQYQAILDSKNKDFVLSTP